MAKQPTISQRNAAMREELLKQVVSSSKGFLRNDFKEFVVDEMINAANNKREVLTGRESVQDRYTKYEKYYDKLFHTGLSGHSQFTGQLEKKARADINKGIDYYISDGEGNEKKVSYAELSYKMELLQHKLSTDHDVAFTKFRPKYFMQGKGEYKVVIVIPDLREISFDEATTEEILEFFEAHDVEIIISDPNNIKDAEKRKQAEQNKKAQQKRVKETKEKFYKIWRQEQEKKRK